MLDFLIAIATSKPALFVEGAVLGVIFDEFLTTKFAWVQKEGREVISDAVRKVKANL